MTTIRYMIPPFWGWTTYTPVIPKLYWDVYSQEERIKRLCLEYDKLTHYASMIADEVNALSEELDTTLAEFKSQVTEQLAEQDAKITQMLQEQNEFVAQQLAEMRQYIDDRFDDIATGMRIYDVTTGTYRPSNQTMRRLAQALAYDHKEDEQLVSYRASQTVAEMGQHTCYNVCWSDLASIVMDDQLN